MTVALKGMLAGRFGRFGGQYVAETLMPAISELSCAFEAALADSSFASELAGLFDRVVGRPSMLTHAENLSKQLGIGVYLKREDLNHTGAHKINNCLGQTLLAKRMGKTRLIAETGAGQHGVATATVAALFDLPCRVYMGAEDVRRQQLNVFRMQLLGTEVVPVQSGSKTLKDAMNEALRDWVTHVGNTFYLIGSVAGPHPYPTMVREFQAVIGREAKAQFADQVGGLPDALLACVGGGSNAAGLFSPFENDSQVRFYGVEAAGDGVDTPRHAATITQGREGVLHGSRSLVLCDDDGQICAAHSISAGLDYPGVGPEHAFWAQTGRAQYWSRTDTQALEALSWLATAEGIICALETAHAFAALEQIAKELGPGKNVIVCLSGRGDKDMPTVAKAMSSLTPKENP